MPSRGFTFERLLADLADKQPGWTAERNEFTEMPKAELKKRLGYVPGPDEPSLEDQEAMARANLQLFEAVLAAPTFAETAAYPAAFDNRNYNGHNFVTPVRDQGGCGSCVAFGVAATAEARMRRERNNPNLNIDFSEAHLFYCHARSEGRRCGGNKAGWWPSAALDAFKNKGVTDETHYPYVAGDQDCTGLKPGWQNHVHKVTGWQKLTDHMDMKKFIAEKGPLVGCFTVYQDFMAYKSGVYRHVSGNAVGGHCISVVGYDDANRYWICKNSWGSNWGESGYFRIAYGECGIDGVMYAINSVETGWEHNAHVTGLWANNANRNAWVHFAGIGWRKISPDNDNIFLDMLIQLATAKAGNRPVHFYQVASVIKQIYVL